MCVRASGEGLQCVRCAHPTTKHSHTHLIHSHTPNAAGTEAVVIDAPSTFVFHNANAFQTTTADGRTLVTL